jgi:lysophospholipase L1-like esterase
MTNRLPAILLGFTLMNAAASPPPLRVACVGDSITYGDQIADRARDAYPAVLERLSAGRYLAGNFGVNGATALKTPFRDWTRTRAYRDAMTFRPDVVVVMLGINDLFFPDLHDRYPGDLQDLVARFQSLPSPPRLFLCTLTPIAPAGSQAHANRLIRDTMNPAIRDVAARTGAQVIDISAAFPNRLDLLPDGLHPNPEGAELIARAVLAALDAAIAPDIPLQAAPAPGPPTLSIHHEAAAARHRAEQWLQSRPPPEDLPETTPAADPAPLLPLLDGETPEGADDLFLAFASLAAALDRQGQETVFIADGRPVAWRETLLHQLVRRQRIDAAGGGYWGPAGSDSLSPEALRATTHALRAIAIAGGRQ